MAIYTGDGSDNTFTGAGNDDDQASGLGGVDLLYGMGGNDTLSGGDDSDLLSGGAGADVLTGDGGDDSLFAASPQAPSDPSEDSGTEIDTLVGGDGNEWLFAGWGDHVDGGSGLDRLWLNLLGSPGGVTADFRLLASGLVIGGGTLTGIEWLASVTASNDDDVLDGTDGNETIFGNGGNDALAGNLGADVLSGDGGADVLFSAGSHAPGAASEDAGTEADTLAGGTGDDQLHAGYGDTVDGGADHDQLSISLLGASSGVTADFFALLSLGSLSVGGGSLTGIESVVHVRGSGFDDVLASPGTVEGGDGNDTLSLLEGGTAYGDAGNDHLVSGGAQAALYGGDGDDTIDGSDAIDEAEGGDGADTIDAGAEEDMVFGDAGNDVLFGGGDSDLLEGGEGNDVIHGDGGTMGATNILGPDSNDFMNGDEGDDILHGDEGTDFLDGGEGFDQLFGGAGDDLLLVTYGDSADGGPGFDAMAISFHDAPHGVTADFRTLAAVTVDGATIERYEVLLDLEGSEFDDHLSMGSSPFGMMVSGLGGNDTLVAGNTASFADLYAGGEGNDTIDLSAAITSPEAWGDEGDDHLIGGVNSDYLSGDDGNDTIEGGAGDDDLCGCEGNDILIAGTGADTIGAHEGNDTVVFGADFGDDHVSGGDDHDRLVLQGTYAGLHILNDPIGAMSADGFEVLEVFTHTRAWYGGEGATPFQYDISVADEVVAAGQVFQVTAQSLAATESLQFDGSAETDGTFIFVGGAGADQLTGGAGNDEFYGMGGGDAMAGGAGVDTVFYDTATAGIQVVMFYPSLSTGEAAGDTFDGIENLILSQFDDVGHGTHDANTVSGQGGNDQIFGQGGDDRLLAGAGNDHLWGGLGSDEHQGGDGIDFVRYDDASFPSLTAALFAPGINTGAAAGDTYFDVEGLILGFFDDWGHGSHGDNYVYGIEGNDSLYGQGGNDQLFGGTGHDGLWGGLGADFLDGGEGFDYARYDDASFPGLLASLVNPADNTGAAQGDTYANLEGLILGFFDDVGVGSENGDYLYGMWDPLESTCRHASLSIL